MVSVLILGVCTVLVSIIFWIIVTRSTKNKLVMTSHSVTSDSSESEDTENNEYHESTYITQGLDTDAVHLTKKFKGIHAVGLKMPDIKHIEECLADYEKVSLIFLLSDNPRDCLHGITLSKWVSESMSIFPFWEEKFWEAMAIIKNFQLPKEYGLYKEDLIAEYFPFNRYSSKHISKFRKTLYLICENFKQADEKLFIKNLKKDFEMRNQHFRQFSQMELYFSFLIDAGYLSEGNTRDCARIAKKLDLEVAHEYFANIEDYVENTKKERNTNLTRSVSESSSNSSRYIMNYDDISLANSDSTQDNVPTQGKINSPLKSYKNDGQRVCFIINQENFYTATEPEYKHLLPPNNDEEKLSTRLGTEVDAERLKSVFMDRGFNVITEKNLHHLKTIEALETMVESINIKTCTCFFVIILSHGNTGVVYCANSCSVKISKIIEIMSNKKLIKIPKVLILQTCQGPVLQRAEDDLTTDGDSSSDDSDHPKTPNFLLFTSTLPGFASIRDKKKGAWFIQALCDQIEEFADTTHFLDICTNVTEEVQKSRWNKDGESCYMVCYKRDTFSKALYI